MDHDILEGIALKESLSDPALDVMNFLNDVISRFPRAISFAPGRPTSTLVRLEEYEDAVEAFVAQSARRNNESIDTVLRDLGQYTSTNSIINDLIARHLAIDEKDRKSVV